jgi:hypothetical protein
MLAVLSFEFWASSSSMALLEINGNSKLKTYNSEFGALRR